jgi:hypothetical protein
MQARKASAAAPGVSELPVTQDIDMAAIPNEATDLPFSYDSYTTLGKLPSCPIHRKGSCMGWECYEIICFPILSLSVPISYASNAQLMSASLIGNIVHWSLIFEFTSFSNFQS